jgi:hypothetical protein
LASGTPKGLPGAADGVKTAVVEVAEARPTPSETAALSSGVGGRARSGPAKTEGPGGRTGSSGGLTGSAHEGGARPKTPLPAAGEKNAGWSKSPGGPAVGAAAGNRPPVNNGGPEQAAGGDTRPAEGFTRLRESLPTASEFR